MSELAKPKRFFTDRRGFLLGSAACATLALLSGCKKGGTDSGAVVSGGTLKWAINNPKCIDPYNISENNGTQVTYQLFDSLVSYDFKKKELVPLAAEKWESDDDAKEFIFHLHKNATFHNGEKVTSQAFKRGWERMVDPTTMDNPSEVSYHLAMVQGYEDVLNGKAKHLSGITCPDDYTLVVKLNDSFADFPYVASHPALVPVPQAAFDDPKTYYIAPIGNGPFMMDGKWADGQYINLKRYDKYYGKDSYIDKINFNIQKDVETSYKEFQAGNIDVCDIPTPSIKEAQEQYGVSSDGYTIKPGEQCLFGEQPSVYYLALNNEVEGLDDPNLRRAMSLAINRKAICETLFMGTREPADNIVPPTILGYEKDGWKYAHYDKDAALAILDKYYPEKNGSRGLEFTLTYNQDGGHKEIMQLVSADLKAVGINVKSELVEWASYLDRLQAGKYQMGRLGWNADYPIMFNFLYPLFYTGVGDNRSQYSNKEVDKLINEACTTVDDSKRTDIFNEANTIIGEDCPVIPLMFYKLSMVGSKTIKTCYVQPDGNCAMDTVQLNG